MSTESKYPEAWIEQVPSVVFGSLRPGWIRLIVFPGNGLADGGVPLDLPTENIPIELRLPNAALWVQPGDETNVARVWRREE